MFALLVVLAILVAAQPALALTCTLQNATELKQRGDVAATGVVDFGWSVPFGFIFATDPVCKGLLPDASLGSLGEGRPPSPDLPLSQAGAAVVVGVVALLRARHGRGNPPTFAGATP